MQSGSWHILAHKEIFSESLLWKLQRAYFEDMGFNAWRSNDVPHYITSNPSMANSYAEIIFAFYREWLQQHPDEAIHPLYIIETGGGSGRFAFHILSKLYRLCEQFGMPLKSFTYVLTDFTRQNVDFWLQHPWFSVFFNCGMLDVALLDMAAPANIELQLSGHHINPASLHMPVVMIANYAFDSIPQELFKIENGQLNQALLTLAVEDDPRQKNAAQLLEELNCWFDYQPVDSGVYTEPWLRQMLEFYAAKLGDAHLLLPAAGLRCLHHLKGLSKQGVMLLSADKGSHLFDGLLHRAEPQLVKHGSFSLSVNYHAFKYYCEQQGGLALFPGHRFRSLNIGCLLILPGAAQFKETIFAYKRVIQDFGPDDFFTITKHSRQYIYEMTAADILAYLRLGGYDCHQLARYLPRLTEMADELTTHELEDIKNSINKAWQQYYPIGEEFDLANAIAGYFYKVDEFELAIDYFTESVQVYGNDSGTLYNIGVCYAMLNDFENACRNLKAVLKHDAGNKDAAVLLAHYSLNIG